MFTQQMPNIFRTGRHTNYEVQTWYTDVGRRPASSTCQSNTVFRGTLTIRALVMGDGVPCYGALEIVGLLCDLLNASPMP